MSNELEESILSCIDTFATNNIHLFHRKKINDIILDGVFEIMQITLEDIIDVNSSEFFYTLNECVCYYMQTIAIPRSYKSSVILNQPDKEAITAKFNHLRSIDQHDQRSKEWYERRWGMLTASSMWMAIGSAADKNRLIVKKCTPINMKKCFGVNITSATHHGHKYEPLSQMFYEHSYETKIEEFGCIPHSQHLFIGASPDGINCKPDNPRYGRMLEIKNIVNREINGIPKDAYWIQMQIQMEVCNLDICDFLETRFKENENEEEFLKDGGFDDCKKIRGVIVQFQGQGGPHYEYAPFLATKTVIDQWLEQCMETQSCLTWIRNIYWALDEYSCITVQRNRAWFAANFTNFKELWETILHDRVHGYENRKPVKKKKAQENIKSVMRIRTESFGKAADIAQKNDLTKNVCLNLTHKN